MALIRPPGAHRPEAFSLKLNRRLTLYRRCAFDQSIMIEVDAAARSFCERPGNVQVQEQRFLADFWVSYSDRQELVLLPGSATAEAISHDLRFEGDGAINVRIVSPADLAPLRETRILLRAYLRDQPEQGFHGYCEIGADSMATLDVLVHGL